MLKNTDIVRVENRGKSIVGYTIPETKTLRRFVANESKDITMGELRQAIQLPAIYRLIESNLIIHNKEAVEELLPNAEPEYFYDKNDVEFLLTKGSLDQLEDALDFAPAGVIDLIKHMSVTTRLNDMDKREAILKHTGFDVTKAIEIRRQAEVVEAPEVKKRRVTAESTTEAQGEAPVRRTAAPNKYSLKTQAE